MGPPPCIWAALRVCGIVVPRPGTVRHVQAPFLPWGPPCGASVPSYPLSHFSTKTLGLSIFQMSLWEVRDLAQGCTAHEQSSGSRALCHLPTLSRVTLGHPCSQPSPQEHPRGGSTFILWVYRVLNAS